MMLVTKDIDLLLKVPQEPFIRNNKSLARLLHTEKAQPYSFLQAITRDNIILYVSIDSIHTIYYINHG